MKHAGDGTSVHLGIDSESNCCSPDDRSNQSDSSDSGSDRSTSRDGEEERTEEEQTYLKFVNSVFFDDDVFSEYSNPTDDDEDENYEPDCKEGNDDEDDDDDDDDLVRVQNRELRELVGGCWQTIAGEVPNVILAPAVASDVSVSPRRFAVLKLSEENQCLKHASIPIEGQHDEFFHDYEAACSSDNRESEQLPQRSVDSTTVDDTDKDSTDNNISHPCRSDVYVDHNCQTRAKHSLIPGIGQSAISHLVTKMFSDTEPIDVCVDGNPVQAVRQLVARQLSMAAQLLIQVLLQADDRSDSFTKAYTSLVELSNLRDAALRKATLVQMNVDNARTIKNNMTANDEEDDCDQLLLHCGGDRDVSASRVVAMNRPPYSSSGAMTSDGVLSVSAPYLERRLTRSSLSSTGVQRPSIHSVLDVPALSRIALLFALIDQSRRNIKHQLLQLQLRALPDPDSWMSKSYSLSTIKQEVQSVIPQMEMRLWTCLLPSANYPLPHTLFASTDPGSLTGRCLFTPAEDDLLLRGASSTVDAQSQQTTAAAAYSRWDSVRARLLPNKESQLLQFRYSQMVSLSSATIEENNFRKFIRCDAEHNARDSKWTHIEELDLLRGFQLFGEKWPLIKMFFLPHRNTHQIRIR